MYLTQKNNELTKGPIETSKCGGKKIIYIYIERERERERERGGLIISSYNLKQ
jgi:hypothetical protein